MSKIILLCVSFFLIECASYQTPLKNIESNCAGEITARLCPEQTGTIALPNNFPLKSIFIGYANESHHLEYIDLIIGIIKELPVKPKVNIMIPRLDEYQAYEDFKHVFNQNEYDFVNLIPVSASESVWVQDYFQVFYDFKTGEDIILDLPYIAREGEEIPASVALACKKELINQPDFKPDNLPGNGDYGGNIEALTTKILMVGNNMSDETFFKIRQTTTQELLEVDVQWLETGHVDELFSLFPLSANSSACEQVLMVASPELAYQAIENQAPSQVEYKSQFKPFAHEGEGWPDRGHCLNPSSFKKKECIDLKEANKVYELNIQKSIMKLQNSMMQVHKCELKVERIPQIFVPLKKLKTYGTLLDRAVSLNPNSVNNILIYPYLLLAKQDFNPFQKVLDQMLENYSQLKPTYVNSKFVHELNGGIHCAVNMIRGCSRK